MIKINISDKNKRNIQKEHLLFVINNTQFLNKFIIFLEQSKGIILKNIEKLEERNYNFGSININDLKYQIFEILLLKKAKKQIFLKEKKFNEIKKIIIGTPEELEIYINILSKTESCIYKVTGKENKKNIFESAYDSFIKSKHTWTKIEYLKYLNIRVCPYCNMEYIYYYDTNKKMTTTAELDHFFNKKDFPWFAISIFNLIPSCKNCNYIKGGNKLELNPFVGGYENKKIFFIKSSGDLIKQLINNKIDKNKLNISTMGDKELKNINETLKLNDRYSCHKQDVKEILEKELLFTKEVKKEILILFSKELKVNFSITELEELIFSIENKTSNYKNKVLSKFTNDIIEDLRSIKKN